MHCSPLFKVSSQRAPDVSSWNKGRRTDSALLLSLRAWLYVCGGPVVPTEMGVNMFVSRHDAGCINDISQVKNSIKLNANVKLSFVEEDEGFE